jgi:hypothetical protein
MALRSYLIIGDRSIIRMTDSQRSYVRIMSEINQFAGSFLDAEVIG